MSFDSWCSNKLFLLTIRGGDLEDVLGLEDVWAMAITFFPLYFGNRKKYRGKFEKTFFFFGERVIFRGKLASPRAKTFFILLFGGSLKILLRTFFLDNTCALCPWSLALASRGSVFEKSSLALDFFCVLGLEGCVLDSTSTYCCSKKYV